MTLNTTNIIHYKPFPYQQLIHDYQLPTSLPILCFIKLLAKITHDTAVLISDKQTAIRIDLILQGKPNHTTYGHSRSPTWLPFTSSHRSHHRCILPKDTVLTYLRMVASRS